jgi:hypothetical protein
MDPLIFAEIALRAEARNYTEVADLDNDSPENRAGWERLRKAALAYARASWPWLVDEGAAAKMNKAARRRVKP